MLVVFVGVLDVTFVAASGALDVVLTDLVGLAFGAGVGVLVGSGVDGPTGFSVVVAFLFLELIPGRSVGITVPLTSCVFLLGAAVVVLAEEPTGFFVVLGLVVVVVGFIITTSGFRDVVVVDDSTVGLLEVVARAVGFPIGLFSRLHSLTSDMTSIQQQAIGNGLLVLPSFIT